MTQQFSEPEFKDKILDEMRELHEKDLPEAQEDWDLIWTISGPPIDIAEEFNEDHKEAAQSLLIEGDKIAQKDIEKKINESNARLTVGIKLAKEVTAKRLGKSVEDLTIEDVRNSGPDIYWNATNEANDNFRQRIQEGWLEKRYDFPREKIIISPNLDILHTGHQFEKFPKEFVDKYRKTIVVTDIYHMPRAKRYFNEKSNRVLAEEMSEGRIVLYPSGSKIPYEKAKGEIDKIPLYVEKGILPREEK